MKGLHLGELEELVLLMTGVLHPRAYGVAVMDELEQQAGRSLNISAVHAVMTRLEEKGLLTSTLDDATDQRGGRRKRIFTLTAAGKRTLEETLSLRSSLYNKIPATVFQLKVV